jgi:hypothetical protein
MAYIDLANLAADPTFLSRVGYALTNFSTYIINESPTAPNHAMRLNWAIKANANVSGMAVMLAPGVCKDSNVIAQLGAVPDNLLQPAVENAANTTINTTASYLDLVTLATWQTFQQRLQVAVATFAAQLLAEDPATANHASRYRWAQNAIGNSAAVAQALAYPVVLQPAIAAALAGATDAQVLAAVEAEASLLF